LGKDRLEEAILARFEAEYSEIICRGHRQSPENTVRTGRGGFIAQRPERNLLGRLDTYREDVLRFANDFAVPFDNNLAERDIRMVKLQQKISGSWRTSEGAESFLRLRSYLSTSTKQGKDLVEALKRL